MVHNGASCSPTRRHLRAPCNANNRTLARGICRTSVPNSTPAAPPPRRRPDSRASGVEAVESQFPFVHRLASTLNLHAVPARQVFGDELVVVRIMPEERPAIPGRTSAQRVGRGPRTSSSSCPTLPGPSRSDGVLQGSSVISPRSSVLAVRGQGSHPARTRSRLAHGWANKSTRRSADD